MSLTLQDVYAGNNSAVIIETLELRADGLDSIFLCSGWEDIRAYANDYNRYITYKPISMDITDPESNNTGSQNSKIVLQSNLYGIYDMIKSVERSDLVLESIVRVYLSNDLSFQSKRAVKGVVKSYSTELDEINLSITYFDILNTNFNRITYNAETSPCLMYQ